MLWDTNARINGLVAVDGWRLHPTLVIPANLPSTKEAPVCDVEAPAHSTASTEPPRSPEEETHNILTTTAKNQAEDGPSTRRAAIRACKYLRAMVNQHGPSSSQHMKPPDPYATQQRQRSSSHATLPKGRRAPSDSARADIQVITAPELISELLHCLSTLPDPCPGKNHYRHGKT